MNRQDGMRSALAALTAALLSSCAGGGGGGGGGGGTSGGTGGTGGGGTVTDPTPSTSYPSSTSAEYTANWALGAIGAVTAWENGGTGDGVLVAVIDDGIESTHPELDGQVSSASTDIVTGRDDLFVTPNTHGSEIASIITGAFNDEATVGIAFESQILGIRADDGADSFSSADLIPAIDYAIAEGADVINLSLGSTTSIGAAFSAALQRATDAGIIIVTSAGNDGASDVDFPGRVATDLSISNGLIVNAGSHDTDGVISDFSNRAGTTAEYYITAPGEEIIVPDFGAAGETDPAFQICSGDTCLVQGTSYSAPVVAGAIAALISAFPGLTPEEIVELLFDSAEDAGAAGIDSVYGYGLLDLAAAFAPIGTVSTPLVQNGAEVEADTVLGITSAAFGDSFTQASAAWSVAAFDSYDRTFSIDLSQSWIVPTAPLVTQAPTLWSDVVATDQYSLSYSLDSNRLYERDLSILGSDEDAGVSMIARFDVGLGFTMASAFNTPVVRPALFDEDLGHFTEVGQHSGLSIAHKLSDRASLTFALQEGEVDVSPIPSELANRRGLLMKYDLNYGSTLVSTSIGSVHDDGSVLGFTWGAGLGQAPEADTLFVHVSSLWYAGDNLRFGLDIEAGSTEMSDQSWIQFQAPLKTSAFAAGVKYDWVPAAWKNSVDGLGATVSMMVKQPLRMEAGTVSLTLPTANEYGRDSLTYSQRSFEPVPSGRELRLETGYQVSLHDRFSLRTAVSLINEPGHVEEADPVAAVEFGARLRF